MISRVLVVSGLSCALAADSTGDSSTDVEKYLKENGGDTASDSQGGSDSGNYQQYMSQYAGGSNGGNYQQYMNKYAGSYQKYMKQYTGGSQGGSQSGDYQQYMNKYAGDYQHYMSQYTGGSQGGGDYQQYMKKYAGGQGGDYQQYMKKYAGGQGSQDAASALDLMAEPAKKTSDASELSLDATSSDSQGNYQQYMNQYAGGQGGSSGNYQKYMNQYAGKYAGDYFQKYIKQYAGKYTGGSQGASESEGQKDAYDKYLDKFNEGSQDAASPLELAEKSEKKSSEGHARRLQEIKSKPSNSQGNYQQYMNQYAGGQGGGSGDYQKYMKQYAGNYAGQYQKYSDYQQYMKRYQNGQGEIGSASDCKTKAQLDKWYAGANDNLRAYVPDAYSNYAKHDIDKKYETRLAEIEGVDDTSAGASSGGPLEITNLDEEKTPIAKSAKTFLAKSDAKSDAQSLPESEVAQSQVAKSQVASLQMYADQMKADPAACAGMALLGVSFASLVFFAVRHRRTVQTPVIMLG